MKVNLFGSSSAVVNQTFVGVILVFMWKEDKSVLWIAVLASILKHGLILLRP